MPTDLETSSSSEANSISSSIGEPFYGFEPVTDKDKVFSSDYEFVIDVCILNLFTILSQYINII